MNKLYKELSECFAPSGLEDTITELIKNKITNRNAEIKTTPRGSLAVILKSKKSEAKPVAVCCDVDETAFIVSDITDDGFIKVKKLTDYRIGNICGVDVTVGNENVRIPGVMAGKVLHAASKDDREKPSAEKMFVNVGEDNGKKLREKIEKGDFVTYASDFEEFGRDKYTGKALECRIPAGLMIEAANDLTDPGRTVIFYFNTKAKTGATDLFSLIYTYAPEKILLLDGISSSPDKDKRNCRPGKGIIAPASDDNCLYYANDCYRRLLSCGFTMQNVMKPDNNASAAEGISNGGSQLLRISLPVMNRLTEREIVSKYDISVMEKVICAFISEKF